MLSFTHNNLKPNFFFFIELRTQGTVEKENKMFKNHIQSFPHLPLLAERWDPEECLIHLHPSVEHRPILHLFLFPINFCVFLVPLSFVGALGGELNRLPHQGPHKIGLWKDIKYHT